MLRGPSSIFPLQESAAPRDSSFLAPPQGPGEMGRLGPYRILKVLGAGSMGIVFLAQDVQLDRLVAIKAMRPSLAVKEEYRTRFLREARATAAIEHPHIVPVYGAGEENNVPWLAMKLLEGESLEDRLRTMGVWIALEEILRIGEEIADALVAAHVKGLIHRDIKPNNIWLEAGGDRVKIIDFGLARAMGDGIALTGTGSILGTPAYMAPEQAAGKKVDHRCDLFSLGCVLYRLSTGVVPFKGNDLAEILTALREQEPTPPHERNDSLPLTLSELILALLAKDPDDRPKSARHVRDALAEMRQALTTAEHPSSSTKTIEPKSGVIPKKRKSVPPGRVSAAGREEAEPSQPGQPAGAPEATRPSSRLGLALLGAGLGALLVGTVWLLFHFVLGW
jgi:serine/threonine protein kinase